MDDLKKLNPGSLWSYFHQICKIPRPSKHEGPVSQFIISFARDLGLEFLCDSVGNILIKKSAYSGCESSQVIVLQSHLDMVCEKKASHCFDFEKDSIIPIVDNGWVRTNGTTLGADNGIGVAAMMAILSDKDLIHGPLECLFTVEEEFGMTGARGLMPDFLSGKILLNLDSEDDGEIFVGCAGGIDTIGELSVDFDDTPLGSFAINISVSGLSGGHSGDDIDKGRANSIKILSRLLKIVSYFDLRISDFHGGNLNNAIPREASALVVIQGIQKEKFIGLLNQFIFDIKLEYVLTDPNIKIDFSSSTLPQHVMTVESQQKLICILNACPYGVIEMSPRIKNLVETSTNLASVKIVSDTVVISTSQRSELESRKLFASQMVSSVFELAGCNVKYSEGYPGWVYKSESYAHDVVKNSYESLFGIKPLTKTIHAGLECGFFSAKYPDMDMVSFGPTIKNAHTPDEKILISSVEKFWIHLIDVLKTFTS